MMIFEKDTPWKINMGNFPNHTFEKENHLRNLLCSMLIFQGVVFWNFGNDGKWSGRMATTGLPCNHQA